MIRMMPPATCLDTSEANPRARGMAICTWIVMRTCRSKQGNFFSTTDREASNRTRQGGLHERVIFDGPLMGSMLKLAICKVEYKDCMFTALQNALSKVQSYI